MTVFDFIVLALVGASIVSGALRGLVRALISGLALIIGLVIAARGYEVAGRVLQALGLTESSAAANAGGFLLITGAALIIGFIAGRTIMGSLKRARLEWFDRVLGGAFGGLRGLAVCSILYLALTAFPVRIEAVERARTAPLLAEGARLMGAFTSEELRAKFLQAYRELIDDK